VVLDRLGADAEGVADRGGGQAVADHLLDPQVARGKGAKALVGARSLAVGARNCVELL
jgi:hypothetical protein